MRFAAIPAAFGLAIGFAILQALMFVALGYLVRWTDQFDLGIGNNVPLAIELVLFFWAHAIFVLLVSEIAKPTRPNLKILQASIVLALVFFAIAALDSYGSGYSCAEGRAIGAPAGPILPWAWIGWFCLCITAFPARVVAWMSGRKPRLNPLWQRMFTTLFALPLVWFFGYVFQVRVIDCEPPFSGWGMFEGGMILIPLLGIFLFTMATSLALISAASRSENLGERR